MATGESIETQSVGLCGSVSLGTCDGNGPLLVNLRYEPFGAEPVGLCDSGRSNVREGSGHLFCKAMRDGSLLTANKHLEVKGRDVGGLIALPPSLATSVAKVVFAFLLLFPQPVLPTCAYEGVVFGGPSG